MRSTLIAATLGLFLLAPAAQAITVGEVMESYQSLIKLDKMPELERIAYQTAHQSELVAAAEILDQSHLVFETIIETSQAAFALYGVAIVCNYDEEQPQPEVPAMIEEFIKEGAQRFGLPLDQARIALYQVEFQEMMAREVLKIHRCPDKVARGGN